MEERGYPDSLRKLSEAVDINRERIRSLASNETPTLSLEVINAICDYYDCDVGSLIVRLKDKPKEETV